MGGATCCYFRRMCSRTWMTPSNVTNGSADSCATITARWPEFFVVAARGRAVCFIGAPLCPLVSAVLACALCASMPRIFVD